MKKVMALLLCVCMSLVMFTVYAEENLSEVGYHDVIGTEYETAVRKMTELKVFSGYEDGSFKPLNDMTRAEFTATIVRAFRFCLC